MEKKIKNFYGVNVVNINDFTNLLQDNKYLVVPKKDIVFYLADTPDENYKPKIFKFENQNQLQVYFVDHVFDKADLIDDYGNINIWKITFDGLPEDVVKNIENLLGGKYKKQNKKRKKTKKTKKNKKTKKRKKLVI